MGHGGLDDDPALPRGRRGDAGAVECRQQLLPRGDPAVHAQRQRRARVARGEHLLPAVRVFAAHAVDPPLRMRPARNGIRQHRLVQRVALPQEAAQQRIDERLGGRARQRRRCIHGVIDDRERWCARAFELIDRDGDEAMEHRIGDGLRRELAHERIERAPMPQRAVGKLLHQGPAPALGVPFRRRESRQRDRQRRSVQHTADRQRG